MGISSYGPKYCRDDKIRSVFTDYRKRLRAVSRVA
ncbi:hypothetical protein [Vibrio phage vB_pir03]|nr:hypothetical protein [Vibrio phage vB_pir03]